MESMPPAYWSVVACSPIVQGNRITREQFWKLGDDSFCLAPNENRTVGYNTTSDMQNSSSTMETLATSVGVTASRGWGAVPASVSASLNYTSTTFQQVSISTETTRYESIELKNLTNRPVVYYIWQLMDVITILGDGYVPTATLTRALQPLLIDGPYNTDGTPATLPEPD